MINFKQYILETRDGLLNDLSQELIGIKVADVIFFPEFHHPPILRIDGNDIEQDQVLAIESRSAFFMVRVDRFAGEISDMKMAELNQKNYEEYFKITSLDYQEQKLFQATVDFLVHNGINSSAFLIWEIDVDDDDVTIRLVGKDNRANNIKIDGVRIEYISEFQKENLMALLGFYDYCKEKRLPFMETLAII